MDGVSMDKYVFSDALTGSSITCGFPQLDAVIARENEAEPSCSSLFFPGCSLINFGLPLVEAVYETLTTAGCVDGISLLCCGKILSFEPEGRAVRASFEEQLRESMVTSGVTRIVAACPNCVVALRSMLALDVRTASIQVEVLPVVLAQLGYTVDADAAKCMIAAEVGIDADNALVCIHDSCPDRDTGEFACGVRVLVPDELIVQGRHERNHSLCCGSLLRAEGRYLEADALACKLGADACALGVSALVAACASCAFQLTASQSALPVFHYLELLYDWRIPWEHASAYMKLRFLFDEALGVAEAGEGTRSFVALDVPIDERSRS